LNVKKDKKKDKKDKKGKDKKGKDKKDKKDKKGKDKKGKKDKKDKKKDKKDKKDKKKDKSQLGEKMKEAEQLFFIDEEKDKKISQIQKWLNSGTNSIANYAICSQFATDLGCLSKDARCELLAKASYYQFQAERCYTQFIDTLKTCNSNDCIVKYKPLEDKCYSFAKDSLTTLNKVTWD